MLLHPSPTAYVALRCPVVFLINTKHTTGTARDESQDASEAAGFALTGRGDNAGDGKDDDESDLLANLGQDAAAAYQRYNPTNMQAPAGGVLRMLFVNRCCKDNVYSTATLGSR
jgi:hypothetical protein